MASEKKYGLIIPTRKKVGAAGGKVAKPSVFGDSSSDEEDSGGKKGFRSSLWQENKKREKQIQSHEAVVKALAEDPSVFEYDNIYDDLQEKKKKSDPRLQKKDTRPKYIYKLKKTAERRKLEQDIIYERKVQRDMEKEGKEYGDKDTFLTSAYRQKLKERKKMEEELKQEEKKDAANDVTKQSDLSKFHRHLLNRLDHGAEEEIPESQRRTSGERERSSHSERERERERERGWRRSESEDDHEKQRERKRSGEERRRSSHHLDRSDGEENPTISRTIERMDNEQSVQEEKAESERTEKEREEEMVEGSEQKSDVEGEGAPKLPTEMSQEDKEERRKVAAAKRTDSQAQLSAKERYLARKRAKTSVPIVAKDD